MAHAVMTPQLPLPPGPRGNFLLGSARDLAHSWPGHSARCSQEYGDIAFYRFLHVPICQLTHPDHIEYVLVKNAANFQKSRDYAALKFILGKGLLTNEGADWQAQRQLIQPAFRHENIAKYAEIMADSTVTQLAGWRDGETRDLHHEMAELTLDIVTKSLFGTKIAHDTRTIGTEIAAVMERFFTQATLSFLLPDSFPIPKTPRLLRSKRHLDSVVLSIIRERRATKASANDLLQTLLDARDEQGGRMTDEQLRDEIMTLFLAGHETTANALTWTWLLLAQNPQAEEKLAAELESALGGRAPSLADLPKLPYTEMVVKESMRLYPPAWGIGRRALQDFELGGYRIPRHEPFHYAVADAPRRAFFPGTGEVRPGTVARRSGPERQDPAVRVLPFWRRTARVHRRGVRNDGGVPAAGVDCAALPVHAAGGYGRDAVLLDHAAAEKRPADADREARCGGHCLWSRELAVGTSDSRLALAALANEQRRNDSEKHAAELTRFGAASKLLKLRCRGSSLVERRPEKAGVASSILAPGTIEAPSCNFPAKKKAK